MAKDDHLINLISVSVKTMKYKILGYVFLVLALLAVASFIYYWQVSDQADNYIPPVINQHVSDSICNETVNSSFKSVKKYSVGDPPTGSQVLDYWTINFKGNIVEWLESDAMESGFYKCSNGKISVNSSSSGSFEAVYNSITKILDWKNKEYTKADSTSDWKTYTNSQYGFEFKYPEKLKLSVVNSKANLNHVVSYKNSGDCDMTGGETIYYDDLSDFNLSFEIIPKVNLSSKDGEYNIGLLKGDWVLEGAEGCGTTNYYFPYGSKTLVIKRDNIQILSGVRNNAEERKEILSIPGVISSEQYETIFNQILSTFKFTQDNPTTPSQVNSFKDCIALPDSKMLETYPEQCVAPDGKTFPNPDQYL